MKNSSSNSNAQQKTNWLQKAGGYMDKHFRPFLCLMLVVSLVVRIIALFQLKHTPYFDFLLWDERIYHEWAKQIASGSYNPQAAYEFSPLPAYLMALIYWMFSPNIFYIRIVNIVFGLLTCLFIALIGKRVSRNWVGVAAGCIAAFYAPFVLYSIVPLKTALSVLLCAIFIYVLIEELDRPSFLKALSLGLISALAFNVRGNYAVFIVVGFFAVWAAGSSKKGAVWSLASFLVGLSLVIAPVFVRNYRLTGDYVLSTTQSGFNFYIGNNLVNQDPYYRPLPFASSSPFIQGFQFTIEASRRVGRPLTASQASSYWYKEALREAVNDMPSYLAKLGRKVLVLFNRFEAADHYDIAFLSQFVPIFKFPLIGFTWIWGLGLAGLTLGVATSRKLRWLLAVFLCYAVTLVAFFTNARYRLPLMVILIPLIPLGLAQLHNSIARRDVPRIAAYLVALAFFTAVEFLPVRATNDRTAYYNTHAIVLYSAGQEQEAMRYWQLSSDAKQFFSASANLALARVYFQTGDLRRAVLYVEKISDTSYQSASKYHVLGDILFAKGNLRGAIEAYEHSLSINSGDLQVRKRLVSLLNSTDPSKALEQYRRLDEIRAYYRGF